MIDCADFSTQVDTFSPVTFFNHYRRCCGDDTAAAGEGRKGGAQLPMYKLKDFPPENAFHDRCLRHFNDFVQMLNSGMPEYMHPTQGALNLATMLPAYTLPPDLGPKGYIACGRETEHEGEGDSVTKLHEDLSDAINIMCHVQHRPPLQPFAPPRQQPRV